MLVELSMTFKSVGKDEDGRIVWEAVASDTGLDRLGEQTSPELFRDWGARIEKNIVTDFLPWGPDMPFLSVSHYPRLNGFGIAGKAIEIDIEDNSVAGKGHFHDTPVGQESMTAIIQEQALVERGSFNGDPIRISAAWFDLAHRHDDVLFVRNSLSEKCPLCEAGIGNKVYVSGQLDHFALTRVPVNPRTRIGAMEEKSMTKITRLEDAASIISAETARELEERQNAALRAGVGKSNTADPVLISKSEGDDGTKANPFLLAYRSSTEEPTPQPLSFDDLEDDDTDGQLVALSDCVFKSHQIITNIFGSDVSLDRRPGMIVKALEGVLERAYDIADTDLVERMKKKGKKPVFNFDKEDEDDEDEDDMEEKSLSGGTQPMDLVQRSSTLGQHLDQVAGMSGTRQDKYQAAQQAVEQYLIDVQTAIDSSTPEQPPVVEQSQAQPVQQPDPVTQQLVQVLGDITKSLGVMNAKLDNLSQPAQVPTQQPVARSLAPATGTVVPAQQSQPMVGQQGAVQTMFPLPTVQNQVQRAQFGQPTVQNGGGLRAMIRSQYGLPNS